MDVAHCHPAQQPIQSVVKSTAGEILYDDIAQWSQILPNDCLLSNENEYMIYKYIGCFDHVSEVHDLTSPVSSFFMYAPSQFSSYSLPLFPVISFPSASRLQVQLGGLGNTVSYPCERVSLLCVCSNLLAIVKFVVSIFWGTETCLVVTNIIFVRT